MPSNSPLSLVALFLVNVTVAMLAFKSGSRFGRWRKDQPDPEPTLPARLLVASILGLLAFILGFMFGSAATHFDSRSQAIFDEAVAIRTAFHRTDLLPNPERENVQRLLRNYVELRIEFGETGDRNRILPRLQQLQEDIWDQATAIGKKDLASTSSLMQSLTDVIDVHAERVRADLRSRIPVRIWLLLYLIASLAFAAAGYLSGLAGGRKSFAALSYALVFAVVIVMIAGADTPGLEQLRMSHQALFDLRARLNGGEMSWKY